MVESECGCSEYVIAVQPDGITLSFFVHFVVTNTFNNGSMKPILVTFLLCAVCASLASAQENGSTSFSGYIQFEWRHYDQKTSANGRALFYDSRKNLFTIRRGRLKATHTQGIMTGVLQFDMTERGLSLKDAYAKFDLLDDDLLTVQLGQFNRPNYEVELSSSKREAPERSQVILNFYPDERDLGFMGTTKYELFDDFTPQLQVGLFNGEKVETDPLKDIIARLTFPVPLGESSPVSIDLGASLYYGGIPQPGDSVIKTVNGVNTTALNEVNENWPGWGNRQHIGAEAQITADILPLGSTSLRGEFVTGQRPTLIFQQVGPDNETPILQLRDQAGYYITFIQKLSDHIQAGVRYDVLDRNTNKTGREVTSIEDVSSSIFGFGLNYLLDNLTITAWYDMPMYAENENGYIDDNNVFRDEDLKDNKATIRFQYKFK